MSLDLTHIEAAADQIIQLLISGEIHEGCCMSGMSSPVTEAWDKAHELSETYNLSCEQKKNMFKELDSSVRLQFEQTGYDDFDVIYELLLQLVSNKKRTI